VFDPESGHHLSFQTITIKAIGGFNPEQTNVSIEFMLNACRKFDDGNYDVFKNSLH